MSQLPHKPARFPSEAGVWVPVHSLVEQRKLVVRDAPRGAQLEAGGADSWGLLWSGLRSAFFSSLLWHLSRWRFTEAQRKHVFGTRGAGVCPRGGGRSTEGVCRQPDAVQEVAAPVKAFLSGALGRAAWLPQPVA